MNSYVKWGLILAAVGGAIWYLKRKKTGTAPIQAGTPVSASGAAVPVTPATGGANAQVAQVSM